MSPGAGANSDLCHIPKLQAIDGVTVAAVANRTIESGQKVADKHKIENVSRHDKTRGKRQYT